MGELFWVEEPTKLVEIEAAISRGIGQLEPCLVSDNVTGDGVQGVQRSFVM